MAPKERNSAPCQDVVWEGARRRSRAPARADVLAGRRRAADHVGPDRHARPAQEAAEPRHLPAAGDRARQGDHALARASRRRARLPRPCARASGHAVPGRRRAGRRSGDDPGRGHAGARLAVRIPVRGAAARQPHRDRQVPDARPVGARDRRDRARGVPPARRGGSDRLRDGAGRPVRRPHGLLQRGRALSGADDRADHAAPRPDLPLDVHGQAAGRARDAGCRAERSVRAAARDASFRRSSTSTCRPRAARTGSRSCRCASSIRGTRSA